MNLQEGLVAELARMRDQVIPAYESIGPPGLIALHLIRLECQRADAALASGDPVTMIPAYLALKEIET